MNATLIMAFILILIVVATVITKKLPFNFVLFIAPVLCALILGHSIEETSTFIVEQLASMMKSAGFMLLFAFLYFQMLTEAGVFDTIVSAITTKLGNKMNVIVIMVLTTLIGGFSILTGNFTPAYLITFPLMVPLYKKFNFDREAAFIIAQTAMSAMCFIPWGIGMAYTASSAGLDANELASASMPWGLCFIPAIIFQWIYFGIKHKRRVGTFQAVTTNVEASTTGGESKPQTKPFLGKLYPLYSLPCGTRNLWHCTILCIYFCNSNYCNDQLQRQFRRNIQQSWTNVLKHPAHAPCN